MKKTIILGTIFITIIMTISANAENISKTNYPSNLTTTEENNMHIDQNIYLTVEQHLSDLQQAALEIEDNEFKTLLNEIIYLIEDQGNIDSEDIQDILLDLGMFDTSAYTSVGVEGHAGNSATCIGFPYVPTGTGDRIHLFAPIVYMTWETTHCSHIDFTIRGKNYDNIEHEALALGGIGYWEQDYEEYGEYGVSEFKIDIKTAGHYLLFVKSDSSVPNNLQKSKELLPAHNLFTQILQKLLENHRFPILEKLLSC